MNKKPVVLLLVSLVFFAFAWLSADSNLNSISIVLTLIGFCFVGMGVIWWAKDRKKVKQEEQAYIEDVEDIEYQ